MLKLVDNVIINLSESAPCIKLFFTRFCDVIYVTSGRTSSTMFVNIQSSKSQFHLHVGTTLFPFTYSFLHSHSSCFNQIIASNVQSGSFGVRVYTNIIHSVVFFTSYHDKYMASFTFVSFYRGYNIAILVSHVRCRSAVALKLAFLFKIGAVRLWKEIVPRSNAD